MYPETWCRMRVIAGEARGHRLIAPKCRTTRPATDLIKGVIFSILENITDDWEQVLDLYAGSGALGIEALSRGADWVDFVEKQPSCCDIIRQNLTKTKLADRAHVYCVNVARVFSFLDKEYSIILMDPPFSDPGIDKTITQLATSRLAGDTSILVVRHSSHLSLDPDYPDLRLIKERRHGDSCVSIFRKEVGT
jgi:16S rRNA (guanine(966)-N(2))-methyltransferase RsmD